MTKVKIKVEYTKGEQDAAGISATINKKFSDKILPYDTMPRIGEWIDLMALGKDVDLSDVEKNWLQQQEHNFRIENVNKCDGYIEVELDMDKVWPEQA